MKGLYNSTGRFYVLEQYFLVGSLIWLQRIYAKRVPFTRRYFIHRGDMFEDQLFVKWRKLLK